MRMPNKCPACGSTKISKNEKAGLFHCRECGFTRSPKKPSKIFTASQEVAKRNSQNNY